MGLEPRPLRCRGSAPPVELSGQLVASCYVGRLEVKPVYDEYVLVMQHFRVVDSGISQLSLVFSWCTQEPLGKCVYQENIIN